MEFKDYYKILGISVDAGLQEIKTAYRKLARKYHPDMNSDKDAESKFKEVAEAYEVLKDAKKRAKFDELRQYGGQTRNEFSPPPEWQTDSHTGFQGSDRFESPFSDFFNSFFGGQYQSPFSGKAQYRGTRGQDIEAEIAVFLEEIVNPCVKTVEYQIPVYDGRTIHHVEKHLKVRIPQGVMDGERIRIKGQGKPGAAGGPAGDLYLHIRLAPHPIFDVQGNNLILTLPITPWEAALGAKITLPTLEGNISVSISPNTQTGKKLRIKGKGLKRNNHVGDLHAIIKIIMPVINNEKANSLWRKLSQTCSFDPRAQWSKN